MAEDRRFSAKPRCLGDVKVSRTMHLKMLRAKIHRARVTEACVEYVGSITIDRLLLDATGILGGECVLVSDLADGARFETYVIEGPPGSGTICINGAAARLVSVGDQIIIMAFAYLQAEEAKTFQATIALVDQKNRLKQKLQPSMETNAADHC